MTRTRKKRPLGKGEKKGGKTRRNQSFWKTMCLEALFFRQKRGAFCGCKKSGLFLLSSKTNHINKSKALIARWKTNQHRQHPRWLLRRLGRAYRMLYRGCCCYLRRCGQRSWTTKRSIQFVPFRVVGSYQRSRRSKPYHRVKNARWTSSPRCTYRT